MFVGSGGINTAFSTSLHKGKCELRDQEQLVSIFELHHPVNNCGNVLFRYVLSHPQMKVRRRTDLQEDGVSVFSWS